MIKPEMVDVYREYIYAYSTLDSPWASPESYRRLVWSACRDGDKWRSASPPSAGDPDPGYVEGMLYPEIDGESATIEQVERVTGISRVEILEAIGRP